MLCTMPGKHGDILWSLPTVRALSEAVSAPIDLLISDRYNAHAELIAQQPYIGRVLTWSRWQRPADPRTPWSPFEDTLHYLPLGAPAYGEVVHLGYRDVPDKPLPFFIHEQARLQRRDLELPELDLDRPWIGVTPSGTALSPSFAVGWSTEHVPAKRELTGRLRERLPGLLVPVMPAGRAPDDWDQGWPFEVPRPTGWIEAAQRTAMSQAFVGCCSALHVLACGLGRPTVIVEPDTTRWNPMFFPYGIKGARVRLACGADGRPTFDADAVGDHIEQLLAC